MSLAPIALFTFKRPAHTLRTLQALDGNPEFRQSPLHVFCDGPRRPDEEADVEATRAIVREWDHPDKTLHIAPANRGLANSIIDGVNRLCGSHGRVIVVEDDLVVAPVFLDFLNRGLDRFSDDTRVMQISGHMFPVDLSTVPADAVFLPFITSWGWATWQRAWCHFDPAVAAFDRISVDRETRRRFDLNHAYPYFAMLQKQKAGTIDSWAIRWYLSVFVRDGLVLYPSRSLVNNEGFDGSGTNCGADGSMNDIEAAAVALRLVRLPSGGIDEAAFRAVVTYLSSQHSLWPRAKRQLHQRLTRLLQT